MRDYDPANLISELINAIFKDALAKRTSYSVIKCVLFQKEKGFPNDSKPVFFDELELEIITPKLEYLMGQLKDVHEHRKAITPQSVIKRYDNSTWVDNQNTLLEFLHLVCATGLVAPIDAKTSNLDFLEEFYPTICVSDPIFLKWQAEHKPKILKLIEERNKNK